MHSNMGLVPCGTRGMDKSGTVPEDELVADLFEELWRVALLPLDKLDDLEPGPALRLALLVLGVAPGMQMKP